MKAKVLVVVVVATAVGLAAQFFLKESRVQESGTGLQTAAENAAEVGQVPVAGARTQVPATSAVVHAESELTLSAVEIESIDYYGYSDHPGTDPRSVANPYALYRDNIQAAKAGDSAALYSVWKSLNSCASVVSSKEAIEELKAEAAYSERVVDRAVAVNKHCAELVAIVGMEKLKSERDRYLSKAVYEGRNAKAALQLVAKDRRKPAYESVRPILALALKQADDYVFEAALTLHFRYTGYEPVRSSTWRYLACQENTLCNPSEYLAAMKHELAAYQIEQVVSGARSIKTSIEAGDFTFLDKP